MSDSVSFHENISTVKRMYPSGYGTSPCSNDLALTPAQGISLPFSISDPTKRVYAQSNPIPRDGLNSIRTESMLFLKLSRLDMFA